MNLVMKHDLVLSAPPVAVASASFFGYSLPEWAAIVTIFYTIVLTVRVLFRTWKEWGQRSRNYGEDD